MMKHEYIEYLEQELRWYKRRYKTSCIVICITVTLDIVRLFLRFFNF
jgi:hypothetical protein